MNGLVRLRSQLVCLSRKRKPLTVGSVRGECDGQGSVPTSPTPLIRCYSAAHGRATPLSQFCARLNGSRPYAAVSEAAPGTESHTPDAGRYGAAEDVRSSDQFDALHASRLRSRLDNCGGAGRKLAVGWGGLRASRAAAPVVNESGLAFEKGFHE